jgi:hypothetical protein
MSAATSTMRAPDEAIVITPRVGSYSVRRYYDPTTGQFISVDPAVDRTQAPYAYAADDPIDNSDPSGLLSLCGFGYCVSTHSFDPMASVDAIVNFGRGASFGLSDTIANWIVPGASCTVPENSFDQFLGTSATALLGGEALGALVRSGRLGEVLGQLADETGSIGGGGRFPLPDLPEGMTRSQFGTDVMRWGTGDAEALARIDSLTREELQQAGVTRDMALQWRDFYENELARNPNNPSAAGRAELMQAAARLLK